MATGPTKVDDHGLSCKIYKWTNVVTADSLTGVKIPYFDDVTIYVHGTANNESVALHGSPEVDTPSLYAPMNSGGSAIALTGVTTINKCIIVDENAVWYKPVLDGGGDGSTLMSIWLVCK